MISPYHSRPMSLPGLLKRRWATIALCVFATAGVAAFWTMRKPALYEARSVLLVQPPSVNQTQDALASASGSNNEFAIGTYKEMLQGRELVEATADKFDAKIDPPGSLHLVSGTGKVDLGISNPDDTDLLVVSTQGTDPKMVAGSTNALTEGFLSRLRSVRRSSVAQAIEVADRRAKSAQSRLAKAEQSLRTLKGRYQIADIDQSLQNEVVSAAGLKAQLATAAATLASLRAEQATTQSQFSSEPTVEDSVTSPEADTTVLAVQKQLDDLRVEREGMLKSKTEQHPDVIAIDARIRQLEDQSTGQLQKAKQRGIRENTQRKTLKYKAAQLNADAKGKAAEVATIGGLLSTSRARLSSFPQWQVQFAELNRQADVAREELKGLEATRADLGLRMQMQSSPVAVVEKAVVPAQPARAGMMMSLAFSIIVGLIAGLLLAIQRERGDRRLRNASDLSGVLGLPTIGALPSSRSIARDPAAWLSIRIPQDQLGVVVTVTSPNSTSGRSEIVASLGRELADGGHRVLLVDALGDGSSLLQALGSKASGEVTTRPQRLSDRLSLVAFGGSEGATTLASKSMRTTLDALGMETDIVLVNAPSTQDYAGLCSFAANTDFVMLIAQANVTTSDEVSAAMSALRSMNALVVAGIIYNSSSSDRPVHEAHMHRASPLSDEDESIRALLAGGAHVR